MIELSTQESYIVEKIRSLRPFESLVIEADKEGRAGRFVVRSSQVIMVTEIAINPVRSRLENLQS